MSWLTVQLRRLADARAATGALMALAFVTSLLSAAAPRILDAQADQVLRTTVAAGGADIRNVTLVESGRIPAGGSDPMAVVAATGDLLDERIPASVAALVRARYDMVETPRFRPPSLKERTVRLRYLQGVADRVRLVSGRLPTGQTNQLLVAPGSLIFGSNAERRPLIPPTELTTFEVALSSASAQNLGVGVGYKLRLQTDSTDSLAGRSVWFIAVEVVGIYEVSDPTADYWFGDSSLERPNVRRISAFAQSDDVTVLISADAYPTLLDATAASEMPLRYSWRHEIDTGRLRADSAAGLQADLRRMETIFGSAGAAAGNTTATAGGIAVSSGEVSSGGPVTLQGGLLHLVDSYAGSWRTVSQVLSVAEVGLAAVALLAFGLVCLLAGRRRAASLGIWQNRGASRAHVFAGALVEVAVVLVAPVAAGAALAIILIPGRAIVPSVAAAGSVLLLAGILVIASTLAMSGDPALSPAGGRRGAEAAARVASWTRGAGPRRLALEAVAIVAAVLGAFVMRQRGVAGAGGDAPLASPDPFVAAVPALIGGAAALVLARLLPVALELLARLAEKRRGLVAMLALRRATRRTNDRLLLTALLTMAAVWSFAAISLAYLDRASDASAWNSVGAPFRVALREGSLPTDLELAQLPGVEAVAYASTLDSSVAVTGERVSMLALDLDAYRKVVRDGPLDEVMPPEMVSEPVSEQAAGQSATQLPVPAVVSSTFARNANLHAGDLFGLVVSGSRLDFRVVAIRDSFPTLQAETAFAVVGRDSLAAALAVTTIPPTEAFIRAGPDAAGPIAAAVQARLPGQGIVTSRFVATSALRDAPEYIAVIFGLAAISLVVAGYGALAIIAALLLAGAEQANETAHLRILGLARGENLRLSAIEHGPASVLVIVAGIALGAGLFAFLQSALGLDLLVGGEVSVGLPIDIRQVAAIFFAIGVIVAAAVALETAAESIINPATALRRGIE